MICKECQVRKQVFLLLLSFPSNKTTSFKKMSFLCPKDEEFDAQEPDTGYKHRERRAQLVRLKVLAFLENFSFPPVVLV